MGPDLRNYKRRRRRIRNESRQPAANIKWDSWGHFTRAKPPCCSSCCFPSPFVCARTRGEDESGRGRRRKWRCEHPAGLREVINLASSGWGGGALMCLRRDRCVGTHCGQWAACDGRWWGPLLAVLLYHEECSSSTVALNCVALRCAALH